MSLIGRDKNKSEPMGSIWDRHDPTENNRFWLGDVRVLYLYNILFILRNKHHIFTRAY